jgi:phosphoserine phosphatase
MQGNRNFKLAIFDLDGTLTRERSIWEYIHIRLGKWYGFAEEYQKQFLAGKISYEEFCERDAQVWKGMRVEELLEIVKAVPFHPGADELIAYRLFLQAFPFFPIGSIRSMALTIRFRMIFFRKMAS